VGDVSDEADRFLGKQVGYVDAAAAGLRHEPQAVTAAEQRAMTEKARRGEERQRREVWRDARTQIVAGVDRFAAVADTQLRRDLRPIVRQVDRISRQLGI
jgi:hypothetical protein